MRFSLAMFEVERTRRRKVPLLSFTDREGPTSITGVLTTPGIKIVGEKDVLGEYNLGVFEFTFSFESDDGSVRLAVFNFGSEDITLLHLPETVRFDDSEPSSENFHLYSTLAVDWTQDHFLW